MIEKTETTETRKWNAMMDALEANWLVKMADTRDEYQRERLAIHITRLEPLYEENTSA